MLRVRARAAHEIEHRALEQPSRGGRGRTPPPVTRCFDVSFSFRVPKFLAAFFIQQSRGAIFHSFDARGRHKDGLLPVRNKDSDGAPQSKLWARLGYCSVAFVLRLVPRLFGIT